LATILGICDSQSRVVIIERVRSRVEIETWGTIVFVDVASSNCDLASIENGVEEFRQFCYGVDETFSTYKDGSVVSQLRRGEIEIDDCSPDVIQVWNLCAAAREITDGSFDPWCVAGGFDPSGYVKGWAADRGVAILKKYGGENIQINCAGDLALAGGFEAGKPWSIGIRHPEKAMAVGKIYEIFDGAVATSGTYERGAHIKDPHTGLIAIGARSASVAGPDGGLTDALATALIVSGRDGAIWFSKPELSAYSAWVIDRHEDVAWSISGDGRL
jgi:thiamine biosynthesis lipoprotein